MPGYIANIGFKYPKPEIFLNSKNRALYTATWLAIRAHHTYTLGTGKTLPPPITSQQWRQFDVVGSFMINEIPNHDLGLTSPDLVERNHHLTALAHLMSLWKGCPDSIKSATYGPLVTQVRRLEEACARFYCQSFFDNFGHAPVIPCCLPSCSLARSEPVTFADSVSTAP